MSFSLRTLTIFAFSTLAGALVFLRGASSSGRLSAEEFEPIKEAEMPRGFPEYTPVGQIEVKRYPAYRKATTSGFAEFWKLFIHIERNNVAMTAPVEMDYGDAAARKPKERSMSFLYGTPELGKTGGQDDVTVSDVPATTVVSIGCRGTQTADSVAEARQQLMRYLEGNEDKYAVAGPLRVMGYNSPFVPQDKNFFEVQIPVRDADAK